MFICMYVYVYMYRICGYSKNLYLRNWDFLKRRSVRQPPSSQNNKDTTVWFSTWKRKNWHDTSYLYTSTNILTQKYFLELTNRNRQKKKKKSFKTWDIFIKQANEDHLIYRPKFFSWILKHQCHTDGKSVSHISEAFFFPFFLSFSERS